jgi:acyl-CoA thioesterase II
MNNAMDRADDPKVHLATVLHVEPEPERTDVFTGQCPAQAFDRVYGGQLAAQGLLAAAATVADGLHPISTRIDFLKIGRISQPVRYEVERAHDGRALASRVVHAYQGDRLLSVSTVAFQHADTEHSDLDHDPPRAPVPEPEELPDRDEAMRAHFGANLTHTMAMSSWPVDVRYIDRVPWAPEPAEPTNRLWMRSAVPLPDDRLTHCAALLYAADLHLFEPILFPNALRWEDLVNARGAFGASLDYTVYFHRDFRFDGWLLHEQAAQAIANSRGLTTGLFWSRDGQLAASVVELVGIFRVPAG